MAKSKNKDLKTLTYQEQILQLNLEKELKEKDKGELQKYFLGLFFYKFLSDKLVSVINDELKEDKVTYQKAWNNPDFHDDLVDHLREHLGYIIEPIYLWSSIIELIKKDEFDNEYLAKAKNAFNDSVLGQESQSTFENIFSMMELTSPILGQTEKDRSKFVSFLISKINDLDINEKDLGNAFEFAYNHYSLLAGKDKAGDFYTAASISKLIAKIVTWDYSTNKKIGRIKSIYDASCGSSSLLLHVKDEVNNITNFYGQDNKISAVNFSKMNLFIHGIDYKHIDIYCQDVLDYPYHKHLKEEFDIIVSDFQFSQTWSGENTHIKDDRFSGYPKFAPKGTADFAFIQHMISLLSDSGKMIVHCPHGVLFRGDSEGEIRRYLIKDKNYIETVISLPSKIVTKKSPSTCLVVISKCKVTSDILFIYANEEFTQEKPINIMSDSNINKIFDAYKGRANIKGFSSVINISSNDDDETTITNQDFNLNLTRYVDIFKEADPIDIDKVLDDIELLEVERQKLDHEIKEYLKELGVGKYGK